MNRREFMVGTLCAPFLLNELQEYPGMTAKYLAAGREIIWRRVLDDLSFEQARIIETGTGPEISGTILIAQSGSPLRVDYCVACDASWRTRTVQVDQNWRGVHQTIRLRHDGQGNWQRDGKSYSALVGCTDIDLGISPSTNALPINRLRLPLGGTSEIKAAWVRFPELDITPTRQTYHRRAESQYQYRNQTSGFTALIDVDGDGLPIDYGNIWRRVAEGEAVPKSAATGFVRALISDEPSTELGDAVEAFGWLIGGWAMELRDFDPDGQIRHGSGEWWFAWVLEGRAIQDVLISPPPAKRIADHTKSADSPSANNRYGTTIRWFERKTVDWRIVWVNPVSGAINTLAGNREGDRIVLTGEEDHHPIRWSFLNIQSSSFTWRGETYDNHGRWRLGAEFQLRRIM